MAANEEVEFHLSPGAAYGCDNFWFLTASKASRVAQERSSSSFQAEEVSGKIKGKFHVAKTL